MSFWPWARQPAREGSIDPQLPTMVDVPVHPIRAWTETTFISGRLRSEDRPLDVLNRREPVTIENPRIVAHGASRTTLGLEAARTYDPFEFDLVLVTKLPAQVANRSGARRIHKVRYRVAIDAGAFEIRGVLHLFPGHTPEHARHRHTGLFMPVTEALVRHDGSFVSDPESDVALVNVHAIREVFQVDWAPRQLD